MTIDAPRRIPDPDPRKRISDNEKAHRRRTSELERGAPSRVPEASRADGTTTDAFNRDVAGIPGSYKAMWMHSTNVIGYNTSDEKYKKNIRTLSITPAQLLALRAVLYDRKATGADEYTPAVHVDEMGLIAGEVDAAIPQLALRFNGEIDSVFYERLGVVLLPFVQAHERQLKDQNERIAALEAAVLAMGGTL